MPALPTLVLLYVLAGLGALVLAYGLLLAIGGKDLVHKIVGIPVTAVYVFMMMGAPLFWPVLVLGSVLFGLGYWFGAR